MKRYYYFIVDYPLCRCHAGMMTASGEEDSSDKVLVLASNFHPLLDVTKPKLEINLTTGKHEGAGQKVCHNLNLQIIEPIHAVINLKLCKICKMFCVCLSSSCKIRKIRKLIQDEIQAVFFKWDYFLYILVN